ncbi:MAG: hypothetical protein AAGH99_00645 [Planctomycetota bacterium]
MLSAKLRNAAVFGVFVAWLCVEVFARPAILTTNKGGVFRGELVSENSAEVVIKIRGIDATFAREDVRSLTLQDTPREIYDRVRSGLDKNDLRGRLALARNMLDRGEIGLAKLELNALNRDFPEHPAVLQELVIINATQRLTQVNAAPSVNETSAEGRRPTRPNRRGETDFDPYLSRDELRLIRVYEVNLDEEPRVRVPSDTLNSFFQKYGSHGLVPTDRRERTAFKRLDGYEQLELIFRVQARDLYAQIEVREEPRSLTRFRRTVNPQYVARYFAPTFGHGQIEGLALFNDRPDNEAEAYTNLYRLTQFDYDGQPMIDRDNPELSLLLQWGLARDAARYPAPDIEGWRPAFRSTDDPRFIRYADWIDTLFKTNSDYGIGRPEDEQDF